MYMYVRKTDLFSSSHINKKNSVKVHVQSRSIVSYHLLFRVSRDELLVSRDKRLALRDEILVSRDECLVRLSEAYILE